MGFFRELRHGHPNGPSLREAVEHRSDEPPDPRLIGYLDAAPIVVTTGVLADDILDSTQRGIAPLDVRTDGLWVWSGDLGYYVRTYHIELPPEFIRHAEELGWNPPRLTDDELVEVDRMLLQQQAG